MRYRLSLALVSEFFGLEDILHLNVECWFCVCVHAN